MKQMMNIYVKYIFCKEINKIVERGKPCDKPNINSIY